MSPSGRPRGFNPKPKKPNRRARIAAAKLIELGDVRDFFDNEVPRQGTKSRAYDFAQLAAEVVCIHILRHGRAMCSKGPMVDPRALGEPPGWAPGQWWVGITEGPNRILKCPGGQRCGACFLAYVESRRVPPEPSAVQQRINRAAAEGRARVEANPGLAAKGPGSCTPEGEPLPKRQCRICGCTDENCDACIDRTGKPCHWIARDLCSACRKRGKMKLGGFEPIAALIPGDLEYRPPAIQNAPVSCACVVEFGDSMGCPIHPFVDPLVPTPAQAKAPHVVTEKKHTYTLNAGGRSMKFEISVPEPSIIVGGLDPGLRNFGAMIIRLTASSITCLHRTTFNTSPKHGTTDQRLALVGRFLRSWLDEWKPTVLGFERISGVTVGHEMRGKGNGDRGPLLMVCGMIINAAAERGIWACSVPTMTARATVMGSGKTRGSSKQDVQGAITRLTGLQVTKDQADAGAMAFAAYRLRCAAARPPKAKRSKRAKP